MSELNSKPPDRLEQAIAALRDTAGLENVPPQLETRAVEALNNQARAQAAQSARALERRSRMFRIARMSGIAAAIGMVGILAGWLLLVDHPSALAFDDVVSSVKNAKSVSFVTKMPTIIKGTQRGTLLQRFCVQGDGWRMEIPSAQAGVEVPPGTPPVLLVLVADFKQHKALELDMVGKTAKKVEADEKTWQDMAKALADPIKQLRQLKGNDAERIGTAEWEGRKTDLYRLNKTDIFLGMTVTPPEVAKLWADPKTGLPVRIAVERPNQDGTTETLFSFEQFRWNEVLAPELFQMEVPEGFRVKE